MPVPNVYETTSAVHWAGGGAGTVPWGTHNEFFAAVMVIESAGETIPAPTSPDCTWHLIGHCYTGTPGAAGSVGLAAYWARAESGDMDDATVAAGTYRMSAFMYMLQNVVETGNPINVALTQTVDVASASISMAAGTSTVPNCLCMILAGHGFDQTTNPGGSGWSNVAMDSTGYAAFFSTDTETGGGFQGGNGSKATQGSLGTWTHTWAAGATKQANIAFAISDTATEEEEGPVGELAATLGALTSSGAGTVAVDGAAAPTLGALTSSGAGRVTVSGAGAATLGALTSEAAGVVGDPPIVGQLGATLGALTSAAAGAVRVTGGASITLGALTSAAANPSWPRQSLTDLELFRSRSMLIPVTSNSDSLVVGAVAGQFTTISAMAVEELYIYACDQPSRILQGGVGVTATGTSMLVPAYAQIPVSGQNGARLSAIRAGSVDGNATLTRVQRD